MSITRKFWLSIAVEFVVFALLLFGVAGLFQSAPNGWNKLAQIGLAALATGALLKTGKRCERFWKPVDNRKAFDSWKPVHSTEQFRGRSWVASVLWVLWFGATVTAWAAAGQNVAWDINRQALPVPSAQPEQEESRDRTPCAKTEPGKDKNFGDYFDAIAIIVALVTSFYLLLLHHALGEARQTVFKIDNMQKELGIQGNQIEEGNEKVHDIASAEGQLRESVLLPLIAVLRTNNAVNRAVTNLLDQKRDIIQAEIAALKLSQSSDFSKFQRAWTDIGSFRETYLKQDNKDIFKLHFQRAQRTFNLLSEDSPDEAKTPEIAKIKIELRQWLKQGQWNEPR